MSSTIIARPSDMRRSGLAERGGRTTSPLADAVTADSAVITSSTELMVAYKQAEVLAPDAKFEALQTTAGNALLFGVSTDGAFSVTQEDPGQSTGWVRTDLGASLIAAAPGTKARTFAVAQSQSGGTIDLALVITGAANDMLYLSLGNSAADPSWVNQPNWVAVPFDDAAHPLSAVVVNDVFIGQPSDGESIVVDVLRDPSSTVPLIFRYYIDPKKSNGQAWHPQDVAGDLDASTVSSCLGRRTGDRIDGIYTAGAIAGHSQLMFQQLYNVFNPGVPANPVRLVLPDGTTGSALVAVSTGDDTTDLFVAAGQTIYYFPANGQHDGAAGVALLNNPLFTDVSALFGYGSQTEVILWGLNRANQIFFMSCDRATVANGAAWSIPLPICQGAVQVAPYVNLANDGNTFFVHQGVNQLQRATRANDTTTWKYEDILLPAPPDAKAIKSSSYTTRIQVTDAVKKPLAGVAVQISAQHRVGVYVNGLYTILDSTPIGIPSDALGAITVVEWIETVRGTPLTATFAGAGAASVNPMAKPFAKAAAFRDAATLRAALITAQDGSTRPLVPSTTSDADLNVAASVFAQLQTVYQTLPANGTVALPNARAVALSSSAFHAASIVSFAVGPGRPLSTEAFSGLGNVIVTAAGDLLSWIEDAANYVVHIVKDAAADVWHFVVEIGGKAYGFVLDAVDQVVGALETIYRAIKTAIEDLIAFLEFLFAWKDFVRTKDVCKKLLLLSFDGVLSGLATAKTDFDGLMQTARTKVDDWAGLKSDTWQAGVANSSQPMSFMRSVSDAADILTAPAMFLYQHFIENVRGASGSIPGSTGSGSDALDRALAALNNQSDIVIDAVNRIKSTLIDGSAFDSLSLDDVLQKLVAIVVDAFLNSTQNVIDALMDVLVLVAKDGIAALDTPIRIPVLSDILDDFGVSINFSMFDIVMMVAAVPATLGYKLANGSAPFPAGGVGDKILAARSLADLIAALGGSVPQRALLAEASSGSNAKISPADAKDIYVVGHVISGVGALVAALLTPGMIIDTSNASYEMALTVAGVVGGMSAAMASIFDSPVPIQNGDMARLATAASVLTLVGKAAGWYIPRKLFGANPTPQQTATAKKVSLGFNAVMAFVALTPTCYHFQELAGVPTGSPRSSAIVNETANILIDLNRITTFFVAVDEDSESKAALALVAGSLMALYGGLQFAESAISPT